MVSESVSSASIPLPKSPRLRVLYSFAYPIGGPRISTTAWHQVDGAARAGADLTVLVGGVARPFGAGVRLRTTLSVVGRPLPLRRLIGARRMCRLHDLRVARWLRVHHREIDVVHTWPLASLETSKVARHFGIPVVLERPNAHTAFAYQAVAEESRRLGIVLPPGAEHKFDPRVLEYEEREYDEAAFLLCPSEFVARTFIERGFPNRKLLRHQYGFDLARFFAPQTKSGAETANCRSTPGTTSSGIVALYAGIGTPRKGLHHALRAWIDSGAHRNGTFLICGTLLPEYRDRIRDLLNHAGVQVLGQQADLGAIMRRSDVFVLPTIEEGSALVTYEARACGCVLLVSDAAGAVCEHRRNALIHQVGDVAALTEHFALLNRDRELLRRLREASLTDVEDLTWAAAGRRLVEAYGAAVAITHAVA